MIKKVVLLTFLFSSLTVPLATFQPTAAIDILNPGGSPGACNNPNAASRPELCKDNQSASTDNPIFGPHGILTAIINILSLLVGIGSVIIIVVEGLRMILAGTDTGAAATARRGIIYACVGLVIALISQTLIALVLSKL